MSTTKIWGVLIIDRAHRMTSTHFLNAIGGLTDRDAECIVTATPPSTKAGEWLLRLKDAPGVNEVRL